MPEAIRREATVRIKIPFHDVDAMHIVWHGHYYKYFEIARTELMAQCGLSHETWPMSFKWVVIETKCRYAAPLRMGDEITVRAFLKDIDHRVNVAFEIRNDTTGERAARGHTVLATLDADGVLLLETPEPIRRLLVPEASS